MIFDGLGGTVSIWVAGFVVLALFVHAVWEGRGQSVSQARRAFVIGLRGLALLLGWLVVAQPTWRQAVSVPGGGKIAVLIDTSASMGLGADAARTRLAQVQQWLPKWSSSSANEKTPMVVLGTTPGGGVAPFDVASATVSGRGALMTSVEVAAKQVDDIGSILLVGDGRCVPRCTNVFDDIQVHTALVGDDPPLLDSAIIDVDADPVAFLRDRGRALVRLRSTHQSALSIELRYDGRVVDRQVVPLVDGVGKAELSYLPIERGAQAYEVAIVGDDSRDQVAENNVVAFVVDVRPSRYRVLHVSGRPSWDQRFLRAFLKDRKDLDLISFFILRALHDLSLAATEEMALIPFPTEELFSQHLRSFDLVIFQNFNYGPYRMGRFLPGIARYVKEGGSFAMIGGELSFSQGGYAQTAVADILPVELPPDGTSEMPGLFTPALREDWMRHPIVGLHPSREQTRALWGELPQAEGANLMGLPKPGAATLMERTNVKGKQVPVLVVGEAEAGRVLALGVDASWTWRFTQGGLSGDGSLYTRFWDRALRWLTRDPLLEPSRISLADVRIGPGEKMAMRGHFRTPKYEPLSGAKLALAITNAAGEPIGKSQVVELDAEGRVETEVLAPTAPGAHFVTASAVADVSEDARVLAKTAFSVSGAGREMADTRPDAAWLQRVSEQSDGTFYASLSQVPSPDQLPTKEERVVGSKVVKPFASAWFLLFAGALFGVEWAIRRRWRIGR